MYDVPSPLISLGLLFSMAIVIELGFRVGCWVQNGATEPAKAHMGAIQGSLLGILALLLGFTFSISLTRHDDRSTAVVDESNAIGTGWLRSRLLPEPSQGEVRPLLRDYLDLRVEAAAVNLIHTHDRAAILAKTNTKLDQLWTTAVQAASADPNPVTVGLFIQSLNDMIDSFGSRDAALNRHVPELVLTLLYMTLLMAGGVIGFTAGLSGHRTSFVTYIMVALIVVLVFIIIDLDRPRRGLIQVSQKSLLELQTAVRSQSTSPLQR